MILKDKHRQLLEALFRSLELPIEVWAYGSRVQGTAHEGSDLDLVVRTADLQPLPPGVLACLRAQLRESNLPILVDVADWGTLPESFRQNIKRHYEPLFSSLIESPPSIPELRESLLQTLKERFERHPHRHLGIAWADVERRLQERPEKWHSLQEMERTGGEPDVVGQDAQTGEYLFFDCAAESPAGRRSLCYDREGQQARKDQAAAGNAVDMAAEMGIELLTEEDYRHLQTFGPFDTKTSSWLKTPEEIRRLGGALFGDYRYGRVFVYHNGAQSYYAARGFRGMVKV